MVKYVIKFCHNPELYTEEVKKRYSAAFLPLDTLCREAVTSGQAKTNDLVLMRTMLYTPVIRLFDVYEGRKDQFDPNLYAECIRLSVDSVLF